MLYLYFERNKIVRMNKFFYVAAVLLLALSSCQSSKVKISGRFVGTETTLFVRKVQHKYSEYRLREEAFLQNLMDE